MWLIIGYIIVIALSLTLAYLFNKRGDKPSKYFAALYVALATVGTVTLILCSIIIAKG